MRLNLNIESVNYIKIQYKDKDGFTHFIKASLKLMDEREIIACAKFEEDFSVATPQDVVLNIACDNGLYKGETKLKYISKEEPYIFFNLRTPENIEYQQKREYFRVKINENAVISYVDESDNIVNITCEVFDLSANGVRLAVDKKDKIPEFVCISLYFPNKTIEADAKYIRTDAEDNILKSSFSFIDLQEADLDYISQICFQKQLEIRRKSLM